LAFYRLRLLLRRGVDLSEFTELEQLDFVEAEKKELLMRFVEQTNFIFATATDKEQAKALVDRLQDEYFIGWSEKQTSQKARLSEEILDMQKKTYEMSVSGGTGVLRISD
jgi:hypothetical protein